jgi:hypothetical protein
VQEEATSSSLSHLPIFQHHLCPDFLQPRGLRKQQNQDPPKEVMSTHASVLVDSVGPPSAEVCRAAASFP